MTLGDWEARYGLLTQMHSPTLRSLPYTTRIWGGLAWELWHLSDWTVTSVSGGSIWLVKK